MESTSSLVTGEDLNLLQNLRQDLDIKPIPGEKISEENEVYYVIKKFFENITQPFSLKYSTDRLNEIYRKISGKDHPNYDFFISLTGNYYG